MTTISRAVRLLVLLCCVLALAGCSRGGKPKACDKPREYREQRSIPPMEIPGGLDAPDPSERVRIPDLPGRQDGEPGKTPCLEQPPDYFDTSPV